MAALRAFTILDPRSSTLDQESLMRPIAASILPFLIWLGLLQVPLRPFEPPDSVGALVSIAATLAALTVAVYRLGVWREQMSNTKSNVTAEVARHREESMGHFLAIERRLAAIEQH